MKLLITFTLILSLTACAREGAIAPTRPAVAELSSPGAIARPADGSMTNAAPGAGPVVGTTQRPMGERVKMRHLRFSTPVEKVRWEKAVDALWRTPLGELYGEYLFSPTADHSDLPLWARMLANRVFREESHLIVRTLALQIMSEDLFVREKMTHDVLSRLAILNGHLEQKDSLVNRLSRSRETYVNAGLVGVSALYGFGSVRKALSRVGKMGQRTVGKLLAQDRATVPAAGFWPPPASATSHSRSIYSWQKSAAFLGTAFIPVQAADIAVNAYYYTSGVAPRDYELLLGMDDLILEMEAPGTLALPDEKSWSQFRPPDPAHNPVPAPTTVGPGAKLN